MRSRRPSTIAGALTASALAACNVTYEDEPPRPPPPLLTIASPVDGSSTGWRTPTVRGTVDHAGCEARFTIVNATMGLSGFIVPEVEEECSWGGPCWCVAIPAWRAEIPVQLGLNVIRVSVATSGGSDEQTIRVTLDEQLLRPTIRIDGQAFFTPATTPATTVRVTGTSADAARVTWTNGATGGSGEALRETEWSWSAEVPLAGCVRNDITFTADNGYGVTVSEEHRVLRTFGYTGPPGGDPISVGSSTPTLQGCAPAAGTIQWSNGTTGRAGAGTLADGRWEAPVVVQPGDNLVEIVLSAGGEVLRLPLVVRWSVAAALEAPWSGEAAVVDHPRQLVTGRSHGATAVSWRHVGTGAAGTAALLENGAWGFATDLVEGSNLLEVTAENPLSSNSWRGTVTYLSAAPSSVVSWGAQDETAPRPYPASPGPAGAIAGAKAVAAGSGHACAVREDGRVVCWGRNDAGQLGHPASPGLEPVDAVFDARAVAVGDRHGCALSRDGTVSCWGYAPSAGCPELCGGATTSAPHPVAIGTATAIAAAGDHTCALLDGGGVRCFGAWSGYLAFYAQPASLSVRGGSACGAMPDGSVRCQALTSSYVGSLAVDGIAGAVGVAVGLAHACALRGDGTVACWGSNGSGQLGNGRFDPYGLAEVIGLHDATAIAAGDRHTCALRAGGEVACWGEGAYGALGDGSFPPQPVPVPVSGLSGATAIAAGPAGNLAIRP